MHIYISISERYSSTDEDLPKQPSSSESRHKYHIHSLVDTLDKNHFIKFYVYH